MRRGRPPGSRKGTAKGRSPRVMVCLPVDLYERLQATAEGYNGGIAGLLRDAIARRVEWLEYDRMRRERGWQVGSVG